MEKTLTRPLVLAAGYFCALLGMVVILGWLFKVPELVQLLPNFAPMRFNAALSFVLCGLGLVFLEKGYHFVTQSLAVVIILVSTLTIVENIFGIDLKIDVFFSQLFIKGSPDHLNRMAGIAALGFLAAGIALLVAEVRELIHRPKIVFFLGLGLSLLGGTTIALYLFGVSSFMELDHLSKMAAHTSMGFLVLGMGLKLYSATTNVNGEFTPNQWHPLIVSLTQYSIQKKFLILFLTLFVGLFVLAGATAKRFQENRQAWATYQQDIEPRQEYLLKMKDLFGYGGGVFYFKNLILRGTPEYEGLAKVAFRDLLAYINKYWNVGSLSHKEKLALEDLNEVAVDYLYNVDVVVDYLKNHKTPLEIDRLLYIDDDKAFAAFSTLYQEYDQHIKSYNIQSAETRALMFFVVIVAAFFTLAISYIFGHFIRATIIENLQNAARFAGAIEVGNFSQNLDVTTKDEFGQLAASLLKMKNEIQAAQSSLMAKGLELERNNQFLNNVFENIPAMIWIKEVETFKYIQLNREGEKLLEMHRSEVIGKTDVEIFGKERSVATLANDQIVLRSKSLVDIPEENLATKTSVKILNTKKIPIFDSKQNISHLIGISHDISEKRRLLQQLTESEERFSFALKSSNIGTWDWKIKTDNFLIDETVSKMLGIKDKSFRGTFGEFAIMIAGGDRIGFNIKTLECIRSETELVYDFQIMNAFEKRQRLLTMRGRVYKDIHGKPDRMAGVIVNAVKKDEEKKVAHEFTVETFNTYFNTSVVGVVLADYRGQIFLANDFFLKLLGYTKMELPLFWNGDSPIAAPIDEVTEKKKANDLFSKGYITAYERELIKKDGTRIAVMMSAVALDARGHRSLFYISDISIQKNLEQHNRLLASKAV